MLRVLLPIGVLTYLLWAGMVLAFGLALFFAFGRNNDHS